MIECCTLAAIICAVCMYVFDSMSCISVPCHEGPPATRGHFRSELEVAARSRYYCIYIIFYYVYIIFLPIHKYYDCIRHQPIGCIYEYFTTMEMYAEVEHPRCLKAQVHYTIFRMAW